MDQVEGRLSEEEKAAGSNLTQVITFIFAQVNCESCNIISYVSKHLNRLGRFPILKSWNSAKFFRESQTG
jgi:hypothetical protein